MTAVRLCKLPGFLALLVLTTLGLPAIDLPPTDHEYTWVERQQINFLNQQLVVDVEPAIGSQNWEEAEKLLREALKNDPNSNLLKGRLLTVLAEAGKNKEALAMAYPLLEKYPRYGPLISFIGNVEAAAGNEEAAEKAWTYLLALPDMPDADRLFAAKSLYFKAVERRDREQALDLARIWAKLEPTYRSNLQYASSLWKVGQREESLRALEKAVRLAKPDEKDEARFYLAYTYLKAGKPGEAETLFQEIATGSDDRGNRRRASMQLAYLSLSEGKNEVARQWLESAAVDGPKDEEWKKLYSQSIMGRIGSNRLWLRLERFSTPTKPPFSCCSPFSSSATDTKVWPTTLS